MAYEKQTWQCGDTITADKLNHMEDGIANSGGGTEPLLVHITEDELVFEVLDTETSDRVEFHYTDVTLTELRNAFLSGRLCIFDGGDGEYMIISAINAGGVDTGSPTKAAALSDYSSRDIARDDKPTAPSDTILVGV